MHADPLLRAAGHGAALTDPTRLEMLNAYKLDAKSPCVDRGLDLRAWFNYDVGTRDFFGNALPQGGRFDVGVHERNTLSAGRDR
jgi:hypothetical protein